MRRSYAANPEAYREASQRYRAAHPEKVHEMDQRWREANPDKVREIERDRVRDPEKMREYSRRYHAAMSEEQREAKRLYRARWYQANREKAREQTRRWRAENREAVNHYQHVRRTQTADTDLTPAEMQELKDAARFCPICGIEMTATGIPTRKELDHIIPLNAGGSHSSTNVRVICGTCNRRRPHDGSDSLSDVS